MRPHTARRRPHAPALHCDDATHTFHNCRAQPDHSVPLPLAHAGATPSGPAGSGVECLAYLSLPAREPRRRHPLAAPQVTSPLAVLASVLLSQGTRDRITLWSPASTVVVERHPALQVQATLPRLYVRRFRSQTTLTPLAIRLRACVRSSYPRRYLSKTTYTLLTSALVSFHFAVSVRVADSQCSTVKSGIPLTWSPSFASFTSGCWSHIFIRSPCASLR